MAGVAHWAQHSFGAVTVADMLLPGAPLIYVNDHFCELTGYSHAEVLGKNCRFLQGPETEPEKVASMQACIGKGVDCFVRLTNHRKDGSTFQNLLLLRPIFDTCGVMRFMLGIQSEMTVHMTKTKLHRLQRLLDHLPRKIEIEKDEGVGTAR